MDHCNLPTRSSAAAFPSSASILVDYVLSVWGLFNGKDLEVYLASPARPSATELWNGLGGTGL